jgi:hypothetical protein
MPFCLQFGTSIVVYPYIPDALRYRIPVLCKHSVEHLECKGPAVNYRHSLQSLSQVATGIYKTLAYCGLRTLGDAAPAGGIFQVAHGIFFRWTTGQDALVLRT